MTTAETPEVAAAETNGAQNGTQRPLDLRTLFDAGVHFGHPSKRWNPKMEQFIFAKRARSHIFDLAKTVEATEKAKEYLRDATSKGAQVLMVGTKKQAQAAVREHGLRAGAWYINQRWLGGMLTNFQTIQKRIERLVYLEDALAKGTVETQTKRESLRLQTEVNRLNKFFGGIKEMDKLPDILFIVDTDKEDIAVREARRLNIPIVAIVDTNSNPDDADYVIPGNDDAVRAVDLLTAHIADAILEGKNQHRAIEEERLAAEAELEAQEAAARAAAQAQAAERAAAVQAEKAKKEAEAAEAAKAAAATTEAEAKPETEAKPEAAAKTEDSAKSSASTETAEKPEAAAEAVAETGAEAPAPATEEAKPAEEVKKEDSGSAAKAEEKKPAAKPKAKAQPKTTAKKTSTAKAKPKAKADDKQAETKAEAAEEPEKADEKEEAKEEPAAEKSE